MAKTYRQEGTKREKLNTSKQARQRLKEKFERIALEEVDETMYESALDEDVDTYVKMKRRESGN